MSEMENKRKRRIKKRTIYAAILIMMLTCFVMIGFLLLFQVRKIDVKGNQYLSSQEVADWVSTDELAGNSIYLLCKYNFTDYELLPAMEDVKVSLTNPWTVRIKVTEKRIAGYIAMGDDFVYFDKDGIVLAQTREWWEDIPCIEGLAVSEVKLFEELPVSKENKKAFENLLDMSLTLKKYELEPDRIVCQGAELYLYFGKVCAILGDDNPEERIAQIPPILEKLGEQSGTLHLENYDENNTTISFEKDVLPPEPEKAGEDDNEKGGNDAGNGDAAGVDDESGENAGADSDT